MREQINDVQACPDVTSRNEQKLSPHPPIKDLQRAEKDILRRLTEVYGSNNDISTTLKVKENMRKSVCNFLKSMDEKNVKKEVEKEVMNVKEIRDDLRSLLDESIKLESAIKLPTRGEDGTKMFPPSVHSRKRDFEARVEAVFEKVKRVKSTV